MDNKHRPVYGEVLAGQEKTGLIKNNLNWGGLAGIQYGTTRTDDEEWLEKGFTGFKFVISDEARERTTYTLVDSLGSETMAFKHNVGFGITNDTDIEQVFDFLSGQDSQSMYIEAQIWGALIFQKGMWQK